MVSKKQLHGLEQPLLAAGDASCETPEAPVQRDTFWPCAMNLAKAVTGAGMMAIPRAYQQIGSLLGTAMLVGVAVLTYFTLAVLINGSTRTASSTYSQLVSITCGQFATKVLQLSVFSFCFGFSVVYLVVIRDILIGSPPACSGLLCEVFGLNPSGPFLNPELVIAAVAVFICAPLLLMRSLDSLAFLNAIGVAAVALLAAVAAFLGLQAVITGTAHPIPVFPQWQALGSTKALQLEALADILPVILACYVVHQNLHPLMPLLNHYTPNRMCGVVAVALGIAACIFTTLAVGAALAFGTGLEINVLNNFSEDDLAPLVGQGLAEALSWVTRSAYLVSVLGSLLLYMHPLRSVLSEVLWGSDECDDASDACQACASPPEVAACRAVYPSAAEGLAASHVLDTSSFAAGACNGGVHTSCDRGSIDAAMELSGGTSSTDLEKCDGMGPSFMPSTAAAAAAAKAPTAAAVTPMCQPLKAAQVHGCAAHEMGPSTAKQTQPAAHADSMVQQQQQQPRWQQLEQKWCYLLTYCLLLAMVLVAILVPSIWSVLSAIGDLASTTQAFMIPGCIALSLTFNLKFIHRQDGAAASSWCKSAKAHSDVGQCPLNRCSLAGVTTSTVAFKNGSYSMLDMLPPALMHMHDQSEYSDLQTKPWSRHRHLLHCLSTAKRPTYYAVAEVLHVAAAAFVVVLGLALFLNGVWQRV